MFVARLHRYPLNRLYVLSEGQDHTFDVNFDPNIYFINNLLNKEFY